MKPILEVQNISKRFRIHHEKQTYLNIRDSISSIFKKDNSSDEVFYALDDVSFNVMPGDSLGIIGRNGAGKSTLLKILSKITPPSSGKIISRGRIASLLEVGTGFHAELSGRENIFLNGSILGMKRNEIQKNFDAIVDFSGVEKFLDTPLKHYSSGMQLRLAFAVAAFLENEILIIDEVLAVGDAEFQKKCMGKMEDVSKNQGRTVLFVSHSMAAIRELCSTSILLKQGKIDFKDDTNIVIAKYSKQYQIKKNIDIAGKEKKRIFLKSIHLHGISSDYHSLILPDNDCFFTLELNASEDTSNVQIGLGINDQMNNRILTLYTRHLQLGFDIKKGINQIQCKIANLPLKPDLYFVHVLIGSNFEIYDYNSDVTELEVSATSFFYKEMPDYSQGALIIKQEWKTL